MLVKLIQKKIGELDEEAEIGNIYPVLEINAVDNFSTRICIIPEDGTPTVPLLSLFEIIDPTIPPDWEIETKEGMYFTIRPKTFVGKKYSFWEDYFDGTPELQKECEEIIQKEVEKIKKFHNII